MYIVLYSVVHVGVYPGLSRRGAGVIFGSGGVWWYVKFFSTNKSRLHFFLEKTESHLNCCVKSINSQGAKIHRQPFLTTRVVYNFGHVCLSVCLSDDNFRKP